MTYYLPNSFSSDPNRKDSLRQNDGGTLGKPAASRELHWGETVQYDKSTKSWGLFADYVNMLLKGKQKADGFPDNVITIEQKLDYIRNYYERGGIR